MVAGLYASIVSIIDGTCRAFSLYDISSHCIFYPGYKSGGFPGPFSCVSRAL